MIEEFDNIARVDAILKKSFGFMSNITRRGFDMFGHPWAVEFNDMLGRMFPDEPALEKAVRGYVEFAIDALKLQTQFEKTGEYVAKTYAEAANEVYDNPDYMMGLYLPGILLSHYLWPHHYRQKEFFKSSFLADMQRGGAVNFVDVGIGTGFYSRYILSQISGVTGTGFDISTSSRDYTLYQVNAFDVQDRYRVELRDILADTPEGVSDWLISVEVLEHLEDPVSFLKGLRRMLNPGGKAFITAALNAPNADHIYLYRSVEDVIVQLKEAGFVLEQFHSGMGHAPRKPGLTVPEISAFIVTGEG